MVLHGKKYLFSGHRKYKRENGKEVGGLECTLYHFGETVGSEVVRNDYDDFEQYKKNPKGWIKNFLEKEELKDKIESLE